MQINNDKLLNTLPAPKAPHSYNGRNSPDDAKCAIWKILGPSYKLQTAVTLTSLSWIVSL